jgi:hypothetical protein
MGPRVRGDDDIQGAGLTQSGNAQRAQNSGVTKFGNAQRLKNPVVTQLWNVQRESVRSAIAGARASANSLQQILQIS